MRHKHFWDLDWFDLVWFYDIVGYFIPWPDKLLNKRSELIARCRHKTKFKL